MLSAQRLAANLEKVREEIAAAARRAGRSPETVRLVAVTKTVDAAVVEKALSLGLRDLGENRLQDALPKVRLFPGACWHFIGHLQTNKVRDVLTHFSFLHSLDRLSLAEAVQKWAERLEKRVEALVQVNVSGEESKYGLAPHELPDFLAALGRYPRIEVRGLMTMAPFTAAAEETRPVFRRLRELRDELRTADMPLAELSMGMTNDFPVAVEEGATMVRIGTALFS